MPRKFLIVEDSSLQLKMYRWLLSENKLVIAQNGLEALDRLALESDVDAIILDINMPKMNGLAFLETIRQNGFGHIPVVVISTEDKDEDIKRALQAGARAYVKKPWSPDQVREVLKRLFEPAAGPAGGPA